MAGFTFGSYSVTGLVEEIQWGEWDHHISWATCFGIAGTSVVDGGQKMRRVDVPVIVSGFATPGDMEAAFQVLESKIGQVAGLSIATSVTIFSQSANVLLLNVKRGKSGFDGVHLCYRQFVASFVQLATP